MNRNSSKKKVKKPTRKQLVNKLDKAFSDYIKYRDGFICFTCEKQLQPNTRDCQCGHLFSRVFYSVRWDEMNAFCQCQSCNLRHEHDFSIYLEKFVETFSYKRFEQLKLKKNMPVKFTGNDLITLTNFYKAKYLELYDTYNQ